MKYYYSKVFRVFYVRYITTNGKTLDTISPENQLFICRLFKKEIIFFFNRISFFIQRHLINLFQEGEKIISIDIVEKCLRVKIKINKKFRADMHFEKITD